MTEKIMTIRIPSKKDWTQQESKEEKQKTKEDIKSSLVALGIVITIHSLGTLLGWCLGSAHKLELPKSIPDRARQTYTYVMQNKETNSESSEGCNLLSFETFEKMCYYSGKYQVPFPLILAVAEEETRFIPELVSNTGDHGIMQINSINFEWLRKRGIEPLTESGNIEAGALMLSMAIKRYGDYEDALMAYHLGDAGAKRLKETGVCHDRYTHSVMKRYRKWAVIWCRV